jgi:hypothetical protein
LLFEFFSKHQNRMLCLTTGSGDEQLVYVYYSPALLHRDETRASIALPDLQPMPSHV